MRGCNKIQCFHLLSFLTLLSTQLEAPPTLLLHLARNTESTHMKFTTALAALLSASTAVFAAPASFTARDIWVPKITYPTAGVVWTVGQTYKVEWSLDQVPSNISNPLGCVYLSKGGLMDTKHPLAENFQLTYGSVLITVVTTFSNSSAPTTIVAGNDYAVVLVGDTGNFSPMFQIAN